MNLFEISEARRREALRVIRDSGVVEAWESVGATVNLVGSVRSGLIMKNLDIDFHIYTDEPATGRKGGLPAQILPGREGGVRAERNQAMLEKSRAAIARLKGVRGVEFRDLLDTEEECLEWHAWYDDPDIFAGTFVGDGRELGGRMCGGMMADVRIAGGLGAAWRLDMIHIRRGSAFDGVIERTTDAVIASLTPETREAILRIKNDAPGIVKGIEVYYAVLSLGLRTYDEFAEWERTTPDIDLRGWMP